MGRGNPLGQKELPSNGTDGQHLVKRPSEPTGNKWEDQAAVHSHDNKAILDGDTASYTTAEETNLSNQSGTNTGDQDLSGLAEKSNVLELDNTVSFTPDADYEPATKKYVDDADVLATKNADSSLTGNTYFKNDSNFSAPDASKVASELAIKVYVDQNIAGVPAKENAHAATTTYLDNVGLGTWTKTGSKATKVLTAGSVGILTIDGHAMVLGDRIYIKNEDGSSTNLTDIDQGIYDVTVEGTVGVVTELTRSDDFDGIPSSEVKNGVYAYVTLGTDNGSTGWRVLAAGDVDVDVDSMVITQFQGLPGNHAPNHTDGTDDIQNATASQKGLATAAQITKLDGIESLAEINNISDLNATDLTDNGESTLHHHNSDRSRANHSGTQTASTISDFDTEVSNNSNVSANTTHRGVVTGNPHVVTKSDVVLGNVDNVQQIPLSQKGAALGVAELDGSGTVPVSQLPNSVQNGIRVIGFWNASTNTPDLSLLTLSDGEAYQISVSGSTSLNGETNWKARDLVVWEDGLAGNWFKIDNTDEVLSVAGQTGAVTLDTDDVTEATNLYYLESRVNANPNVAANTAHRGSDGKNHSDVVLNNAHRVSDGKNHSDVVLNNSHRTSNGASHSFIDQDVTATGNPTFNKIKLPAITTPAHDPGTLFYDSGDDELAFYNSESDVKLNIGTEHWVKVRNNSGATINDFTPVYQTGAIGNRATIAKAQADSETTSRVIGITTHQIENNTDGFITVWGAINDVDTDGSPYSESWSAKDEIFLSAATAGSLTKVAPIGNNIVVSLGNVLTAANNGSFLAKIDGANVRGTSSVTDNSIVRFDGTSGKRLKESTGINASEISIATGAGSPTVNQLQEYLNNTGSSGFFLGGILSDGGAGTLNVAAGSGFIRTTNDPHAELQSFKWSESLGIAVTDNTTQYVYVDDLGVITLSTDEFLETPDKIQIGVVTKEGGLVEHVFSLGVRLQESIGQAGRFIRRVFGLSRDKRKGGLIFGQSADANRDVSMTTGIIWWGRTEYPIPSFDTSGADTFSTYSAGGQEESAASQWNNLQYDNAGTLTTLANNRWANLFFFIEPDNHIVMVYGREQHNSEIAADQEAVPSSSLPSKISETSLLAARFTFQKSSNIATISSAFDQLFANAGVADHGDLAGLGDDDHPQYLLNTIDRAIRTETANYTIVETDRTVLADATSNTVAISLPAIPNQGQTFNIKCINATFTCTIARNGNNIENAASDITLALKDSWTLQFDSTYGWARL